MAGLFRLSPRVVRWGGLASILAGLLSITYHVLARSFPFQFGHADTDYLLEAIQGLGAAAGIVTLVAIRYLHVHADQGYGWLGTIGFSLSLLGSVARSLMVAIVVLLYATAGKQAVHDTQYLWSTLYVPAMIGGVLGTTLFGIALARARVLPLWFGVLMALSFPIQAAANMPGIEVGYVAGGLIAIVLGATLWSKAAEPLGQPTPGALLR